MAELFTGIPVMGEIIAGTGGTDSQLCIFCGDHPAVSGPDYRRRGYEGRPAGKCGVGLLFFSRLNKNRKENLKIVGALYVLGVFWGVVIELLGIVF